MLESLKVFFTDWLPSLAILGGGAFAWWRWRYAELLRRQREIPSADLGTLTATPVRVGDKVLVQVDALWRNPGRVPFHADVKFSTVDVFAVPDELVLGPLQLSRGQPDLHPKYSTNPFRGLGSFRIEPGADEVIQTHFVLPETGRFIVRWKLYRKNDENKRLARTRFLLVDTATLTVTSALGGGTGEIDENSGSS